MLFYSSREKGSLDYKTKHLKWFYLFFCVCACFVIDIPDYIFPFPFCCIVPIDQTNTCLFIQSVFSLLLLGFLSLLVHCFALCWGEHAWYNLYPYFIKTEREAIRHLIDLFQSSKKTEFLALIHILFSFCIFQPWIFMMMMMMVMMMVMFRIRIMTMSRIASWRSAMSPASWPRLAVVSSVMVIPFSGSWLVITTWVHLYVFLWFRRTLRRVVIRVDLAFFRLTAIVLRRIRFVSSVFLWRQRIATHFSEDPYNDRVLFWFVSIVHKESD